MSELDDLRQDHAERDQLEQRINQRLVAAYHAGYTYAEIADVLDITPKAVGKRLAALGVTPRPRGPNPGRPRGAS